MFISINQPKNKGKSRKMNKSSNVTDKDIVQYTTIEIFSLIAFSIVILVGGVGNILVIYVYGFTKRRRFAKFEKLMLMLGIVDLVASITNPLYFIYRIAEKEVWKLGYSMCKLVPALGPIFTSISLGIILIMAVDRDRAISTPFKEQFKLKTIRTSVFINVCCSVPITIPYINHLNTVVINGKIYCMVDVGNAYNIFVVCMFGLSDVIFLLVFTITTLRIYSKLRMKKNQKPSRFQKRQTLETNRIIKTIFTMGFIFVICVFPRDMLFIGFSLRRIFPPSIPIEEVSNLNNLFKVLHTSNSCVNIFLYSVIHKKFRREIITLLKNSRIFRSSLSVLLYKKKVSGRKDTRLQDKELLTIEKNNN